MEKKYCVTCRDNEGNEQQVYGDNLEELSAELKALEYDGPSLRVCDEPGFTVGWVSGEGYRAA